MGKNKNSGKFSVNTKQKISEKTVNINFYNTKNKRIKVINKKAYDIKKKKTPTVQMPPNQESQINLNQLNSDLKKSAKEKKAVIRYAKKDGYFINDYMWYVDYYDNKYLDKNATWISVGNVYHYMDVDANGATATIKAKNNITIYGNIGTGTTGNVKDPTEEDYDFKLRPGETKVFYGIDFDEIPDDNLFYKVKGYKNGKLIMMNNSKLYLIAGMYL